MAIALNGWEGKRGLLDESAVTLCFEEHRDRLGDKASSSLSMLSKPGHPLSRICLQAGSRKMEHAARHSTEAACGRGFPTDKMILLCKAVARHLIKLSTSRLEGISMDFANFDRALWPGVLRANDRMDGGQ